MCDEKVNDKFGNWNPMVNDRNAKLSHYATGPSANLDN